MVIGTRGVFSSSFFLLDGGLSPLLSCFVDPYLVFILFGEGCVNLGILGWVDIVLFFFSLFCLINLCFLSLMCDVCTDRYFSVI